MDSVSRSRRGRSDGHRYGYTTRTSSSGGIADMLGCASCSCSWRSEWGAVRSDHTAQLDAFAAHAREHGVDPEIDASYQQSRETARIKRNGQARGASGQEIADELMAAMPTDQKTQLADMAVRMYDSVFRNLPGKHEIVSEILRHDDLSKRAWPLVVRAFFSTGSLAPELVDDLKTVVIEAATRYDARKTRSRGRRKDRTTAEHEAER
jgi:hypothetical protein